MKSIWEDVIMHQCMRWLWTPGNKENKNRNLHKSSIMSIHQQSRLLCWLWWWWWGCDDNGSGVVWFWWHDDQYLLVLLPVPHQQHGGVLREVLVDWGKWKLWGWIDKNEWFSIYLLSISFSWFSKVGMDLLWQNSVAWNLFWQEYWIPLLKELSNPLVFVICKKKKEAGKI